MFQGYCPETMDFLWGLRLNNEREWFLAHKEAYQRYLYEPTKLLAQEVFAQFRDVPNMDCKFSRIYKDARMHPVKPYKESLWLVMRPEGSSWSEQPSLYFEVCPEGCHYGFILWSPKAQVMERFRQMIAAKPEEFLQLIRKVEKDSGIKLYGNQYCRKKPCPDERLEPYYNLKNLQMIVRGEPGEEMFSPQLAQTLIRTLKSLYPLYEYCLRFSLE